MAKTKDKPVRDMYPRLRAGGNVYYHYVTRAHKWEANRDKATLRGLGYKVRIKQIFGRWVVYRHPKNL